MEAVPTVFSGNRMGYVIMTLGIISIILGVIFWYQGYSQASFIKEHHLKSTAVMQPENYYMIAAVLVIIGIILVIKNSEGGGDEKVDWPKVAQQIKDLRKALDHVHRIKIQSEGDIAYAEPLGDGRLTHDKIGAWVLSTSLDVDNSFARAHAGDYINIAYPYENQWVEILDNSAAINTFRLSDQTVTFFLEFYVAIPKKVSYKKIQQELKKYNVNV